MQRRIRMCGCKHCDHRTHLLGQTRSTTRMVGSPVAVTGQHTRMPHHRTKPFPPEWALVPRRVVHGPKSNERNPPIFPPPFPCAPRARKETGVINETIVLYLRRECRIYEQMPFGQGSSLLWTMPVFAWRSLRKWLELAVFVRQQLLSHPIRDHCSLVGPVRLMG